MSKTEQTNNLTVMGLVKKVIKTSEGCKLNSRFYQDLKELHSAVGNLNARLDEIRKEEK